MDKNVTSEMARRHPNAKHGMRGTPTYNSWISAKTRCLSRLGKTDPLYGGRGITVCKRWAESFSLFLEDMGERPPGCSLDRINNDGNYEPGNCRWATDCQQSRNKRTNKFITAFGETKTLIEWAADPRCVVGKGTLVFRASRGWNGTDAITKPSRNRFASLRKAQ